jgi:hypothetical protein
VTIDAHLRTFIPGGDGSDPLPGRGISVALLVLDGDGRPQRLESPAENAALFSGDGQRIEVPLTIPEDDESLAPSWPVSVIGVEVLIQAGEGTNAVGTIDLLSVESNPVSAGDDWSAVALDPAAAEWHWDRTDFFGVVLYLPPDTAPGRIVVGTAESLPIFGTTTFRLWPLSELEEIPVVAGAAFLEQSGARVGDTITASGAIPGIGLHIIGSVERFPTLDPSAPFIIADDATVELSRTAANGQATPVSEWWIDVAPGTEASVLEALRAGQDGTLEAIGRQELTTQLSNDPVALGVLGVLGLGSLAAMAFASIAFLASATVSTTERVGEFAILRALGLSARQLAGWLAAESAFLLGFGLIAGSAAGILLGWLVLPFASFTPDGSAAVPSPVVIIPLAAIAPLYGLTAILFLASVAVVRRQLPSVRITDVLRGRDEAG